MLPLKIFILAFFVSIYWGSQVLPLHNSWREIFPLFHWSLFSTTAGEQWQYFIYFPDEQCELKDCPSLLKKTRELELYWPVQELGISFQDNSRDFVVLKKQFEELLSLEAPKSHYELRMRRIFPADFVREGKVLEEKVLGTFKSGEE